MAQSFRLRLATFCSRLFVRRALLRTTTPKLAQQSLEHTAKLCFKVPPFLCHLTESSSGIRLNWLSVGNSTPRKVILYFHGGAYISGSAETHRGMLGRISKLSGVHICALDYRLLQEAPFPVAFDDAREAWDHLVRRGYDPHDIILGGDSAGGGLMLALLSYLNMKGVKPAGAFAISPWTDLTMSGASLYKSKDAMLPVERLEDVVNICLGDAARDDPRASPLFASYDKPPPVLIQVGIDEALADGSRMMTGILRNSGGDVTLNEWDSALHVFQILDGWLPEARLALQDIATFVQTSFDMAKR